MPSSTLVRLPCLVPLSYLAIPDLKFALLLQIEIRSYVLLELRELQEQSQGLKAGQRSFYSTETLLLIEIQTEAETIFFHCHLVGLALTLTSRVRPFVETILSLLTSSPVPLYMWDLCHILKQAYKHLKDHTSYAYTYIPMPTSPYITLYV